MRAGDGPPRGRAAPATSAERPIAGPTGALRHTGTPQQIGGLKGKDAWHEARGAFPLPSTHWGRSLTASAVLCSDGVVFRPKGAVFY